MSTYCCTQCGAGLNLKLTFCEYCRTPIQHSYDHRTQMHYVEQGNRYRYGWIDPKALYGNPEYD